MRTFVNRTTGFTPFFLKHGHEARLPVDMIAGPPPDQSTTLDCYTEKLRVQLAKAFSVVSERQNCYVLRQKELNRERHHKISVDDLVWLYTDRSNPNLNTKFQSFWSSPYHVTRNLANTLFEIQSYGRWTKEKIVTTMSVDRLKKVLYFRSGYEPWHSRGINGRRCPTIFRAPGVARSNPSIQFRSPHFG